MVRAGQPMFGVIAAANSLSVGVAIDDLELIATCSDAAAEWRNDEWNSVSLHVGAVRFLRPRFLNSADSLHG
jgi:hypothetical protein